MVQKDLDTFKVDANLHMQRPNKDHSMRMPEPEVSLRLAIYLVESGRAVSDVAVSIDGAHVKTGNTVWFDAAAFMNSLGWYLEAPSSRWQGTYRRRLSEPAILIHSQSGKGDVVTQLHNGYVFFAEAKKGPLLRSQSSAEYQLVREALGQVLTLEDIVPNAILAIAVPHGERFIELADRWRSAPLIKKTGIQILTVAPSGEVFGLQYSI